MTNSKICILGTEYRIKFGNRLQYKELENVSGYCDPTTHEIVIKNDYDKNNPSTVGDLKKSIMETIRHEIIHAYFYESGLWNESYGRDEELIDWIAIQFPKIQETMNNIDEGVII